MVVCLAQSILTTTMLTPSWSQTVWPQAYRYQGRLIVPEYGPLEQNARNEGKGLWSDPHAIEPRQWRKANN